MFGRRSARRNGPGLVGTVARTAVIAGTAQATANSVNARAAQKQQRQADAAAQNSAVAELQQQVEALQAQEAQAVLPAPSGAGDDLINQLARLGELHQSGILTAEEFTAAKARLLA